MSKVNTRATINANIKQNGNQEISGQTLNSVLNTMVDDYAEQEKLTELDTQINGGDVDITLNGSLSSNSAEYTSIEMDLETPIPSNTDVCFVVKQNNSDKVLQIRLYYSDNTYDYHNIFSSVGSTVTIKATADVVKITSVKAQSSATADDWRRIIEYSYVIRESRKGIADDIEELRGKADIVNSDISSIKNNLQDTIEEGVSVINFKSGLFLYPTKNIAAVSSAYQLYYFITQEDAEYTFNVKLNSTNTNYIGVIGKTSSIDNIIANGAVDEILAGGSKVVGITTSVANIEKDSVVCISIRKTDEFSVSYKKSMNVIDVLKSNYAENKNDITLLKNNIKVFGTLSLFSTIGVIGDSYASGVIYTSGTTDDDSGTYNELSWGKILGRRCGNDVRLYSQGGMTTRSWLTHTTRGLPKLLAEDAKQLYVLALGINDSTESKMPNYLGTLSDITSHTNRDDYADTFYGNYGRIVEEIIAHAPRARIVMSTMSNNSTPYKQSFNNAIVEIASHYGVPCIRQYEHDFFNSEPYIKMQNGHPVAVSYSGMAIAIEELICKTFETYYDYYKDFIG